MANPKRTERIVPLDRVFLNLENPRHEPVDTQAQAIEWLCSNEEVPQLARDIAQHGLSPLYRFGVTKDNDAKGRDATYVTAEGNRRLCALKLLTDPDLAPPEKKAFFEKLAATWTPITEIPCVVFEDMDDLDLWLKRHHHGPASGVGLKPWNADQKSRHSGAGSRNRVALGFLDWAEKEKLISSADRQRRLTTVQRYLGNPVMRETMGIDASDPDNLNRNRTEDDVKLLAKRFIADMLDDPPKVTSRQNKDAIETYARALSSLQGQSHQRVEAEPLLNEEQPTKKPRRGRPGKAKRPQKIPWNSDVADGLKALRNWKLDNLYRSLCNVPLQENTPLLAVGAWSFFETLSARTGKNPDTDFLAFLSSSRLEGYGLGPKKNIKPLRDAVERILHYGNATKHHDTSASFNGDQLANDMEVLGGLIVKMIEDAKSQS